MKVKLVSITLGTKSPAIYKNIDKASITEIKGGVQFIHKGLQITYKGEYTVKAMLKEKANGANVNTVNTSDTNK